MNKQQAYDKGYKTAGHFGNDKEEIKAKAAKLRVEGNKAVVVNEPPSKLSRGHHGMGYIVMWIESEENKAVRLAKAKESKLAVLRNKYDETFCQLNDLAAQIKEMERK